MLLLVTGLGQTNVALIYFIIASIYLLLSLALYLWISRHPFYRQYADHQSAPQGKGNKSDDKANIREVISKVWLSALTVLLVYLVTLGNEYIIPDEMKNISGIYPALPALANTKTNNSTWKARTMIG